MMDSLQNKKLPDIRDIPSKKPFKLNKINKKNLKHGVLIGTRCNWTRPWCDKTSSVTPSSHLYFSSGDSLIVDK